MHVIGHDDEGVQFVEAFGAIVLQSPEQERCVGFDLKETAAVIVIAVMKKVPALAVLGGCAMNGF